MEHLKWNEILDRYLIDKIMSVDDWEELDDQQKWLINELKKAYKRINKPMVNEIHHSLKQNEKE